MLTFILQLPQNVLCFSQLLQFYALFRKQKDRLDWMYKGPGNNVNRDDYLMGKEIDKAVLEAPKVNPHNSWGKLQK